MGDQVLYATQLLPILGNGDSVMTLLTYDQVVHALGFGITAWGLWHVLTDHCPETRRS